MKIVERPEWVGELMKGKRWVLILVFVLAGSVLVSAYLMGWLGNQNEVEDQYALEVQQSQPRLLEQGPLILKKEDFEELSPWQRYVTPSDSEVQALAGGMTGSQQAYSTAVLWIWVSDQTLNGVPEKWLMPHEFLAETPTYPTNPVPYMVVSDCESQAYTLVSLLRAMGVPAENVRVVVGKVDFGGQVNGHAWVEIYENEEWFALEATSGPYWDDEEEALHERHGYPYDYFKTHSYPSIEVWGYFNDVYYYNPSTGEGNAPAHWRTPSIVHTSGIIIVFQRIEVWNRPHSVQSSAS